MLTEDEKKWIERRERMEEETGVFFCQYCEHLTEYYDEWIGYCDGMPCPVYPEELEAAMWKDAAEFEARVASSIARDAYNCAGDEMLFQHQEGARPQGWYILRDARLVVEEEMEEHNK